MSSLAKLPSAATPTTCFPPIAKDAETNIQKYLKDPLAVVKSRIETIAMIAKKAKELEDVNRKLLSSCKLSVAGS